MILNLSNYLFNHHSSTLYAWSYTLNTVVFVMSTVIMGKNSSNIVVILMV